MGAIELYDALVAAGAPEEKARAAASTVRVGADVADKADIARLDARFDGLARRLGALDQRLGAVETRLSVTVTLPELQRATRQLQEQIAAPNWKSILIQTIAVAAVISFVLRVL